jgi:hypothetical protein
VNREEVAVFTAVLREKKLISEKDLLELLMAPDVVGGDTPFDQVCVERSLISEDDRARAAREAKNRVRKQNRDKIAEWKAEDGDFVRHAILTHRLYAKAGEQMPRHQFKPTPGDTTWKCLRMALPGRKWPAGSRITRKLKWYLSQQAQNL